MEDIKQIVSALTSLIQTHRKRISAYLELSRVTSHAEIKSLCERHVDLSNRIVKNLVLWRSAYGTFTQNVDHHSPGDVWHQLRLIFSFNPENTNINRCEELEWGILEMYKMAIPLMPSAAVGDLQSQVKEVRQMMMEILEVRERKHGAASLATK